MTVHKNTSCRSSHPSSTQLLTRKGSDSLASRTFHFNTSNKSSPHLSIARKINHARTYPMISSVSCSFLFVRWKKRSSAPALTPYVEVVYVCVSFRGSAPKAIRCPFSHISGHAARSLLTLCSILNVILTGFLLLLFMCWTLCVNNMSYEEVLIVVGDGDYGVI